MGVFLSTDSKSIVDTKKFASTIEASDDFNIKSVLKDASELLARRKRLLVAVAIFAVFLGISDYFFFRSYTISGTLLFDTQSSNTGLKALLGSLDMNDRTPISVEDAEDQKSLMALETREFQRLLTSSLMADPNFAKYEYLFHRPTNMIKYVKSSFFSLFETEDEPYKFSAPMPFKVRFLKRGILSFSFKSADKEAAILLGNHYLKSAVNLFSSRENQKIGESKEYIQSKIQETIKKMEENDRKIVGVSTKNASTSFLAAPAAVGEKLLDLREQIQKAEFTFEQNNKVIESLRLKQQAGSHGKDTQEGASHAPEASILSSMIGIGKTITNLQTENELLQIKIHTLKSGLQNLLKTNLTLPKDELLLAELKRAQGLDYYLFDNLIKTLLQIEVKGLSLLSRVYPLEMLTAQHVSTTTPLTKELTLCLIVALLLTAGGLFAMDYVNPVVRRKADFDSLKASFLADLPKISDEYFDGKKMRICQFNVDSKETIAFKHARARLTHLASHSGSEKRKVVSFLSYGNNEGKSFISSNLAACFAHSGTPTVLIDFDLRRGALTKNFEATEKPGLCDFLRGTRKAIDEIVIKSVLPNLDLIPAGKWSTEVTESFSNAKFNSLMDILKAKYEFIVLDTAPLVVAHESLAIAQDSDFAILISTAWKTRREYVVDALEEIENVRLGRTHILLNHAKEVNNQLISNYYYVSPSKVRGSRFSPEPSLST